MSNAVYTSLTRLHGLEMEMRSVANNLANSSTTGYKSDRPYFAEFLVSTESAMGSLSMGGVNGQIFNLDQGAIKMTGASLDAAIQGDGYFAVDTAQGPRLTRAGSFTLSPDGVLMDPQGSAVLAAGGNPINIPENASNIAIGADGTLTVDGEIVNRLGVFEATGELQRETSTYFVAPQGYQAIETATVVQGALEQSNVSPVLEISRMIEVQRAYEAGQSLIELDGNRLEQTISTLRER
ncbi:MAG: flagellar hook-basal body complex protein [Pseudomonadota bacterium]